MNNSSSLDGHEVPGPGHYDTTKMKPNARSAPSITIGVRYAVKEQVSENPGPQHYVVADGKKTGELLSTKTSCKNTIFGTSKRWAKPAAASDVGPGKYQGNYTSFGKQVSSNLETSSTTRFGTGPQRQIGKLDDCSVPYVLFNIKKSSHINTLNLDFLLDHRYIAAPSMIGKGPKISMHFREKFGSTTFTKGNNPGPGAYTPEDQPGRAGTAKVRGFGFGSAARLPKEKHSENPGPGHYGVPNRARKTQNRVWTNMRLRSTLKSSRR